MSRVCTLVALTAAALLASAGRASAAHVTARPPAPAVGREGVTAITGILIDPTGRNSIAILRDVSSKEQYRVKVGQQIGRMRVARIAQKTVTFTIEEFGYSRQQELALDDSNQVRTK